MSTETFVWILTGSMVISHFLAKRKGSIFQKHQLKIALGHGAILFAVIFGNKVLQIMFLLSLSIFAVAIHEAGHAVGAVLQHLKIEKIIVLPIFGAVKISPTGLTTKKQFWLTWAGPASAIPVLSLIWLFPHNAPLKYTALLGAIMGALNILPIMFLDGGKLLGTLLEKRTSEGNGALITLGLSVISIAALALIGVDVTFLALVSFPIVSIVVSAIVETWKERKTDNTATQGNSDIQVKYGSEKLGAGYFVVWILTAVVLVAGFFYFGGSAGLAESFKTIANWVL